MGEQYLIDSNAIIDYLDGKLPVTGMLFMNEVVNAIPNVSIIAKIEVLGYNQPEDKHTLVSEFIDSSVVFDLNDDIVTTTIALRKITKIKVPNAIIAGTPLAYNLTLITRNTADFVHIPNLKFCNPYLL